MFYNRNDPTCFRSQDFTLWIVASTMLYLIVLYWSFHFPNNFSNLDLRLKKIYHHWIYVIPQYQLLCAENYYLNSLYSFLYFLWYFFYLMKGFTYFFYNASNHYSCITPQKEFVVPDLWAVWMAFWLGGGTTKQAAGTRPSWPLLLRILQRTPSLLSNSKQSMPFSNNI